VAHPHPSNKLNLSTAELHSVYCTGSPYYGVAR